MTTDLKAEIQSLTELGICIKRLFSEDFEGTVLLKIGRKPNRIISLTARAKEESITLNP